MKLERHELSAVFGGMPKPQFDKFKKNLLSEGQRVKGVIFESKVLDGWNRYLVLGDKFEYAEFKGTREEAARLVVSLNLQRRHLSDDQRACAAAEMNLILKKKSVGHNQATPKDKLTGVHRNGHTHKIVCETMNISTGRFNRASYLKKHHPELFQKCKNGEKSVNKARLEAYRIENGICISDSVVFPDVFSHHCEVEKFIKHITKNGWDCTITIVNGLIEASLIKTVIGTNRAMGDHYICRSIISAALPHKIELMKILNPEVKS